MTAPVPARLPVNWDGFWLAHEPVLIPLGAEEEEARNTAVFIGCPAAGGDRDAQLADARQLLEACGLIPYQAHPRSNKPPAGCATTNVSYERPGS